MNTQAYEKIGEEIIKLLDLDQETNGRVKTAWGTKSPEGLARSIERIFDEKLEESTHEQP